MLDSARARDGLRSQHSKPQVFRAVGASSSGCMTIDFVYEGWHLHDEVSISLVLKEVKQLDDVGVVCALHLPELLRSNLTVRGDASHASNECGQLALLRKTSLAANGQTSCSTICSASASEI